MGSKPQPFESSPAACNGTFGEDALFGLVMSPSGVCAILKLCHRLRGEGRMTKKVNTSGIGRQQGDRKSTRLNSSHTLASRMPSSA